MNYLGKLCVRGHNDGGGSMRYANGCCTRCTALANAQRRREQESPGTYPESEWLQRNAAMLRKVEPRRRPSYIQGVEIVRGEDAAKALAAMFGISREP